MRHDISSSAKGDTKQYMHRSQSESDGRAQVLSFGWTLEPLGYFLKDPHIWAMPQVSKIRISGDGSWASLYLKAPQGFWYAAQFKIH